MQKISKWLAILLTLSLLLNLIPLNVLAAGQNEIPVSASQSTESEGQSYALPAEGSTEVTSEPSETEESQVTEAPAENVDDETPTSDTNDETSSLENESDLPTSDTEDDTPMPDTDGGTITSDTDNVTSASDIGTEIAASDAVNQILTVNEEENPVATVQNFGFSNAFAERFANVLVQYGLADANTVKQIIKENGSSVTLHVGENAKILVLLSNQTQSADENYCNWTIDFNITGPLVLGTEKQSVTVDIPNSTDKLSYQGLGDEGFPFAGTFTGNIGGFASAYTIFKSVSVAVEIGINGSDKTIPITWDGTQEKPILANILVADSDERTLNMPLASSTTFSPYIGELSGNTGLVTLPSLNYSGAKSTYTGNNATTGNLGLVCNHMASNTNIQINVLQIPNQIDLRGTGNVGGLVGQIDSGATLHIGQALNMNVKLEGNNAGSLVGLMDEGSISFDDNLSENINVSAEVKAANAGGLIGQLSSGTSAYVNPKVLLNLVKANGTENAGILYGKCTVTSAFNPFDGVTINDGATTEVSGSLNCGGVFGTLILNGNGKCTISGTGDEPLKISSTLSTAANTTMYGGIAGTLEGTSRKNALVVNKCDITSSVNVGTDSKNYPKYLGGIAAVQGSKTTIDAKDSTVTLSNPRTPLETYGIGGLCTEIRDGALLIADTMTVVIDSFIEKQGSSGIAASTGKGTVVFLKNSLDLSRCLLATYEKSGQIVGKQDCSLIYAPTVNITRLDTTSGTTRYSGVELDDIGNYGELYRISDLLEITENYENNFLHKLTKTGDEYVLGNALDYACLALAWQSRGNFLVVDGITSANWDSLQSSTITLADDINLNGCGIGGLTRDCDKEPTKDKFSGTFNGGDHTITLDIGAENMFNKVPKGDGRIYWHNATGLFAILSSNATVNNLTLGGSIRLSNNKYSAAMHSGALAALIKDNRSGSSVLNKVSTSVEYNTIINGGYTLYLGGLIGLVSGADTQIDFNDGTTLAAIIKISHSGNGCFNHIGGAIGGISADSAVNITYGNASIAGSIVSTVSSGILYNFYAGGLIGTIFPSGNKTRSITINNLSINNFILSGNANDRMGGILGGIWANANVTITGLNVTGTTLTSSGKAAVGGLVYRASGKWEISNVDLSGLTIYSVNASALGLMVCHGEPYKELINNTNTFTEISGLYLEMTEDWDTSYKVPGSITFGGTVFDEFVAYTAYRSTDGNYDIMRNGSGIISLKTTGDVVNMTDGARNTYVNRTTVGKSKQTNQYSRYYYNLKSIMESQSASGDDNINTNKELLIWSVHRYADSTLRKYFTIKGIDKLKEKRTIGGTGASETVRANFDMKGLSYYPIDISNENITVQYANVKFYNDDIENKESGNKSTRDIDGEHSQHYMMHCALFRNFNTENIQKTEDYTMTVNGVSFAGSVGVVNEGSGALLCGTVAGQYDGRNTAICKIVLASEDSVEMAITLNGISVVSEGVYTPVLINRIDGYSTLEANYIETAQTTYAGSSLIGKVGRANASKVTLTFAGTIKLPEEEGVFTKATLLYNLQYADGSATYTFNYKKDDGKHDATHGKELTTSVEYEGKIGCYDDQDTTSITPQKEGATDFKDYLPYVAFSPALKDEEHTLEKNWHELAVNIHSYNILEGCGTYGHPYIVTAKEFQEAANFVNTGKASNKWQIRMPKETAEYHNVEGDNDEVVTYSSGNSELADKIQKHLRSAYYRLQADADGKFQLSNFHGIGSSPETAFKGVIDSVSDKVVTVSLTGGSSAFIKYSYGSVVRNVNFDLNQTPTLSWKKPGRTSSGTTPAQQAPGTFFGGVIGCVLGGDNIIDNVTVTSGSNLKLTLTGDNAYLVPTGGYVGVIAGGGVIFRGTCSESVSVNAVYNAESTYHIYSNPIIGRVLGGYAFYEGDGTVPNNSNGAAENYKINKISLTSRDLEWDGSTLTVNNAQGLLILSAIVSSGAGSANSDAYNNGVARKAKYDKIGETTKPDDYEIANDKDNTSYLSKYVTFTNAAYIQQLCTSEGIALNFAENGSFNMAGYGNGYRGLSARYVSNAAFKDSDVAPDLVVLRVKTFNGQNTTVTGINMDVKEYANDDFHMASMGGIFNIVWTKKDSGGTTTTFARDLAIENCVVSLRYVDDKDVEQKQAATATFVDQDGLCAVTVGGFIGSVSDDGSAVKTTNKNGNYLFDNIKINGNPNTERSKITGPNSAGGLIGASAMTGTYLEGCPGILLSNKTAVRFGPNFLNCSYSNVDITGKLAAGGLIGVAYAYESTDVQFGSMGCSYSSGNYCFASCTVTAENLAVGTNSNISATSQHGVSAGLFGIVGMRSGVNDPKVNTNTGLTVAEEASMKDVVLSNVLVTSSTTTEIIYRSDNTTVNGPDKSQKNTAAGGIIGRISHANQSNVFDVRMSSCSVDANTSVDNAYAAGMVAYGYTNTQMVVRRCNLTTSHVNGKYAGGLVGYGWNGSSGYNLHVSDCEVSESTINGTSYSGGLVGRAGGKYYITNVLIKNTSITGHNTNRGRLFGEMNDSTNTFYVRAAGVSVFVNKTGITFPAQDGNTANYNGYIAYADYAGTDTPVENEISPYVTVNPNFPLTGADKMLTGDAVKIARTDPDNVIPVASRIWEDQKSGVTDENKLNRVPYQNISSDIKAKDLPEISTFYGVQNCGPDDLPVLTIKGGDTSVIEDYLNVITNGGYAKAKTITKNATNDNDKVLDLRVGVYSYKNDAFAEKSKADLTIAKEPASIYVDNGELKVLGSSYDNTRNRFSLVEATFKVTVDGEQRTYTVSVPVVVIRELQYDFMATFAYGAEFQADTFATLEKHVLENTGNPFTGYLSYVYNQEKGEYVPYEWQSYMDSGGNMLEVNKVLNFNNGLPQGTQMILIDCQNGNKAYQYKAGASIDSVNLSDFTSVSDGTNFCSSMAEVLGVKVSGPNENGKYVKTTNVNDAKVRLNGEYYRLYTDGDGSAERYDLTVPDLSLEGNKAVENYYLMVTVPDQGDQNYFLNGNLTTKLDWSMPNSVTQVHRYNPGLKDGGGNTESSYQIYSGYTQDLVSLSPDGEAINLMNANNTMKVALKDTITFSSKQAYGDDDPLFVKFIVSLQEHRGDSTNKEELQFRVGTSGTVHFYVQDSNGQYYFLDGSTWKTTADKDEAARYNSYDWISQGNNMELTLSVDGNEVLDLAWVRQTIKGTSSLESKIIITAEMDIEFGGQEVLNATVPASEQNGTDIWAQLHYVGMISTQASSLNYTANRTAVDDNAHYYRGIQYQAILSLDATRIDQLGVNPLELVASYMKNIGNKEASQIELNAALNLSNLPNYESILQETKKIEFSLSLMRRNGSGYTTVENASDYIAFAWPDGSRNWNWTISQDKFCVDGKLVTSDWFRDAQFTFPLTAFVFIDQKEFANYKINLRVSFMDNNNNPISVSLDDKDAYVVYTYACIKPTFYEPPSRESTSNP